MVFPGYPTRRQPQPKETAHDTLGLLGARLVLVVGLLVLRELLVEEAREVFGGAVLRVALPAALLLNLALLHVGLRLEHRLFAQAPVRLDDCVDDHGVAGFLFVAPDLPMRPADRIGAGLLTRPRIGRGHLHGGTSGLEPYRALDVGMDATGRIVVEMEYAIARAMPGTIKGHH